MPDAAFRQDLDKLKAETRVATQRLVMKHLKDRELLSQALSVRLPSLYATQQHR